MGTVDGKAGKDFSVETKSKDGSGNIKTSQTVTDDGKGTVSKTVTTESSHTSTSGGPGALPGGSNPHLDHMRAHEEAVRAAQAAHAKAMENMHHAHIEM